MTDEEILDWMTANCLHDKMARTIALARRGLRAEREVCGTCRWHDVDRHGGWCSRPGVREFEASADDYCSRWRERSKP